ncbi:MAG: FAD-dependent oxidoreductase [Thermoguttaceae bacterium]|nr:FAD-dependent oxidoreductase [Thermoguttaceae bacterium]
MIECAPRYRQYDGSFADLLRELNVSESAVEAFWRGFVLSATAETPELAAASAVVADFVSIFGEGEKKATVLVPNLSLREIYHVRTLASLEKLGVETKFTCKIRKLETIADSTGKRRVVGVWDGETLEKFDKVVLATDAFAARDLLVNSGLTDVVNASRFSDYECGSITTAHLWLDRPLTNERIVALGEGPAQWLFQPRKITPGPTPASDIPSYYCQALIKASHRLLSDDEFFERGKDALIDRVWRQLQVCFPNQSDVKIVASRTSTALDAVISPSVSTFRLCPPARTVVENMAFAGDWIATGSPPSMESAASSGFMAIDALF